MCTCILNAISELFKATNCYAINIQGVKKVMQHFCKLSTAYQRKIQ